MLKAMLITIVLAGVAGPAQAQVFGTAPAVTDAALQSTAGRADLAQAVLNRQENRVAGNSVTGNSVTGSVAIDGNAFQNLNGLAVINANSGNNVAINSALNVNISIAPR